MNYPIGELARRAGYAVQTLRYYEQTGLMPKPSRTQGRQRRYSEADRKRLLFIRHARNLGFKVADMRSLLDLAAHPDRPCASVDAIERPHLLAVEDSIARLNALRTEVSGMLQACANDRIADCKVNEALANHER